MSKKVNELTPKVDRYTVTDADGQLSATEYNVILDAVQRHEAQLAVGDFLRFSEQALDDNDKRQARQNIGAVGEGDYASKMSVGFADNLVGRGEATSEEFVFQPTANDVSVQDGTARVKKIKGNSVVWNNLMVPRNDTQELNGVSFISDGTGKVHIIGTATAYTVATVGTANIISGNKYTYYGLPHIPGVTYGDQTSNVDTGDGVITTPTYTDYRYFVIKIAAGISVDFTFYPKVTNLTQMFGAGDEPTTIEDFYARIPSGIDIHAYNKGEIISMHTEAIRTVGFNQWDEQWELGTLTDVGAVAHNSAIISRNFNKILPSTAYYCAYLSDVGGIGNILQIGFWDMNMVYIDRFYVTNKVITTPANAAYFKVATNTSANITTYNHDICINLSHTGYRNGEYEPYREFTRELPVIKKYFPEGMRKAGSVADSIEWDSAKQKWVAVQRVGVVDLGDLDWGHPINDNKNLYYVYSPSLNILSNDNILSGKYITSSKHTPAGELPNKTMKAHPTTNGYLYIRDNDYTDVSSFKASVQGVMLYYELAEPIVTEIEEKYLNFDYDVEDFGTEEALSSVPSAPFSADIIYQFNAVDSIRQNRLDIKALRDLVLSLQSQIAPMQAQEASTLIE